MVILTISVSAWFSVCYVAITCFTISYDLLFILVIPMESCRLRWSWLRFDYNLTTLRVKQNIYFLASFILIYLFYYKLLIYAHILFSFDWTWWKYPRKGINYITPFVFYLIYNYEYYSKEDNKWLSVGSQGY